jgi:hypothetical protein
MNIRDRAEGTEIEKGQLEFLEAARNSGKFEVLNADPLNEIYRVLVTVGNQSRPFDMSLELCRELGVKTQ